MEAYDCTKDVKDHIQRVRYYIHDFAARISGRGVWHDASKLEQPEKSVFDEFTPKLKGLTFGSDEYKAALVGMGDGLKHHYQSNRHHPEHFENGVNGMTLVDIVEMVCDWKAASGAKGMPVDMAYLAKRFGIDTQLAQIIANTLEAYDE